MNFNRTRLIALGVVTLFSSPTLFAQMDAMSIPVSATQANQMGQQQPATTSMQDSGPNSGDVGQAMKDKMFLRGAAATGLAEVKLGQLAMEKSTSDDVKAYGQKMVDDHIAFNKELAPVADSMGVRLPREMSKDDQAEYDKLETLSGSDFDTAYLLLMVKGHHRAMRNFRVEANGSPDPALQALIVKGESIIHEHLAQANKMAREKGIPLPSRRSKTPPPTTP